MPHQLEWTTWTLRVPAKPLLTRREVADYLEIGTSALRELIEAGQFPRPIAVSPKTQRWRAEWVALYLQWRDLLPRLVTGPDPGREVASDSVRLDEIGSDSMGSGKKRRGGESPA